MRAPARSFGRKAAGGAAALPGQAPLARGRPSGASAPRGRATPADERRRQAPLRGLPGALLHRPRPDRRLRPLHERAGRIVRTDPMTVLDRTLAAGRPTVPFAADDWDGSRRPLPDRHRRRHHLPRLQARPLHRQPRGRGRRRRHRRHRGDLQLLRRQGEDRHRPPPRPRGRDGPRRRRARRPRHHRRVRLADALARRRRAPDRRLEGRGPRHLRHPARALRRASRSSSPSTAAPRSPSPPAGRRSSTASPETRMRVGCGSAAIGMFASQWRGPRRRGRRRRRPHHRRRLRAPGRPRPRLAADRHPHPRPPLHPRPLLPRRRSRPRLGRHHARRPPRRSSAPFEPKRGARPGLTLLMVSTTGEEHAYYELDADLVPRRRDLPDALAPDDRADRRELRAVARLGAVLRRRRRLAARRGHRQPGPPHPRDPRAMRPGSPAAARRSGSGPAAASPSWST